MKQLLSIIFIALTVNLFGQIAILTPLTQASNVTITNITTTSFKVDWTSGSGLYEIVIVRPTSSSNVLPVNANMPAYSASSSYGAGTNLGSSNYVVYKSSGTSVTVTGLTPGINYEAVVYSYNYGCLNYLLSSCNGGNGYLVKTTYNSSNSEQHYTLASQPTVVPTLSVISTGTTTASLSCSGTSQWNLVYLYNPASASFAQPVDGNYYSPSTIFGNGSHVGGTSTANFAVYNGAQTATVNITNLAPATSYYGLAYANNGTYGTSTNTSYNYFNSYAYVYFSTYNTPPTLNTISNYTVCQDAATTNLSISGIGDGSAAETQTVSIAAYSSNTTLMPNPTISYTHPNSTGTLSFKPNAGQSGTVVITVVAQDGGPNNNATTKTFTVNVLGIPANAGAITTTSTTICQVKNGVVFTVPTIANATTYNWSLPPGSTVTAGANTGSITVNFNTTALSYNVNIYGSNTNGCGN